MENLDLKGAVGSIFQKDWWKKYLGLLGIYLLPIIGILIGLGLIGIGVISKILPLLIILCLLGVCLIIVSFIGNIIATLYTYGYFMLYGHDISHDKNALYRSVFSKETFKDGLIAGAKGIVAGFVMIPFFLLFIPLAIIAAIIFKGSEIGIYAMFFAGFLLFAVPITKIMAYFIKDMDVTSLFHWGKAFEYSKEVKSAFWVVAFPLVAGCAFLAVLFGIAFLLGYLQINTLIITVLNTAANIFGEIIIFMLYAFYFNLLGQYTYAVIKQKEGVEPETLPKEIKNGNTLLIVLIVVIPFFLLTVLGVVAALTIPSLVNRQSDLAAKVRMKKAIAAYEDVAAVYMLEKSTPQKQVKDLKDFAGENCENLGNYFKMNKKYDDCAFTTVDGVYWLFDPKDGSVNISDNAEHPKYNITLGVCENGMVNCREEFPDVTEFMQGKL